MRDYSEIQIPIEQARQSLYYERREDAFSNWYSLYHAAIAAQGLAWISEFNLKPIAEELGLSASAIEPYCPLFSGFEEIRLREIYVKCPYGTRFALEVSRWEPIPAVYGECAYDGNSRQTDDEEKDDGLPNGSQPQSAPNPSNPYDGFPAPSNSSELGDWDNINKIENVDLPNPVNAPADVPATENTVGWYCRATWVSAVSTTVCNARAVSLYKSCPRTASFSSTVGVPVSAPCTGHNVGELRIEDVSSGFLFTRGYVSPSAQISFARLYGLLPYPDGSVAID
jgi:hypothetical protein